MYQFVDGYRSAMDGCLLVAFVARSKNVQFCAEFGMGTGLIGISLAAAGWTEKIVGIEINAKAVALAKQNIKENGLESRVSVTCGDVRDRRILEKIPIPDAVIMNPPFWEINTQRLPQNIDRRIGDHEVFGGLGDWVRSASKMMKSKRNRLYIVYPAGKIQKCVAELNAVSLSIERLCFVHPSYSKKAEMALIEARKSRSKNTYIEPALYLKDNEGIGTSAAERILNGEFNEKMGKRRDRRDEP